MTCIIRKEVFLVLDGYEKRERLKQLSLEQLDSLLIEYTYAVDEIDDKYVKLILDEMKSREESTSQSDAREALNEFYANYTNDEFLDEYYGYLFDDSLPDKESNDTTKLSTPIKKRRPIKRIAFIAAAIIVVMGSLGIAQASGFDVFSAIARWTSEIFTVAQSEDKIVLESRKTDMNASEEEQISVNDAFIKMNDSLISYGIEKQIIPTWIPDRFKEIEFSTTEEAKSVYIMSSYQDGDSYLSITIRIADPPNTIFEKSDENLEILYINNVSYYLFTNNDSLSVSWYTEDCECSISGHIQKDELTKMLESIK